MMIMNPDRENVLPLPDDGNLLQPVEMCCAGEELPLFVAPDECGERTERFGVQHFVDPREDSSQTSPAVIGALTEIAWRRCRSRRV